MLPSFADQLRPASGAGSEEVREKFTGPRWPTPDAAGRQEARVPGRVHAHWWRAKVSEVLSNQRPEALATLGFPGLPLCSSSPQPQPPRPRPLSAPRLPSQISHPWWTAGPPSSAVRDWPRPRQRLLFESWRRHLPSPRPALRLRLGLLAPRQFLWKLGQPATSTSDLPARAGARGRRDCALETEAWASASSLSTQVPGRQGVDIVEATREKKRFKDLELLLLLFSWKRRASEVGKFEFSF